MRKFVWLCIALLVAVVVWGQQRFHDETITCPLGMEPSITVEFDGKGNWKANQPKCTPVQHRWASELDGKKDGDGGVWDIVNEATGRPASSPTIQRYQIGKKRDGQRTLYQLDWCIDHGETRVIRKGQQKEGE